VIEYAELDLHRCCLVLAVSQRLDIKKISDFIASRCPYCLGLWYLGFERDLTVYLGCDAALTCYLFDFELDWLFSL